jgi:acetolactate synthase regulatory subunit
VIYEATIHDQLLVARIINLAHRCGCGFRSVEAYAEAPTTRVRFEFTGSDRSLRLLRTQVDKLMTYDFGISA